MAAPSGWFTRLAIVYFTDWFIILATIAFAGSMSLWATPSARPFSLSDRSIAYPHQNKAKIPTSLLLSLAILLPVVVCVVLCLLVPTASTPRTAGWKRRVYAANKALLGLLLSIALAMLLTDSLKNLMGKPRPDMLSRCNPAEELLPFAQIGWDLVTWDVCANLGETGKGFDDLRDGFRSFPSGHASMSFAGLTYTTLFLASFVFSMQIPFARSIRPFSSSTPPSPANPAPQPKFPQMLSFFIIALPMFIATYIASTRWSDYRHHGFDVLFGSFEGVVCALVGWGWYGVFSCRRGGVFHSEVMSVSETGEAAVLHPAPDYEEEEKSVNVGVSNV